MRNATKRKFEPVGADSDLWKQNVDKLNDDAKNNEGMNGGKVVQVLHYHETGQDHYVLDFSHTKKAY